MVNDMRKNLKQVIAEWKVFELPEMVERDTGISLEGKSIVAIVGVRRAGKTYTMFHLIKELIKDVGKNNILYVDFENPRLAGMNASTLNELLVVFKEMMAPDKNRRIYLFLDEIQNVEGWERWVRILHNKGNYKIIISGSSATLLSREIATSLRGRSINFEIYPFSFKEFLRIKNFSYDLDVIKYTEEKGNILRYLNEYINYGGFPEVVLSPEELKRKLLTSYFETIFHRDILERYRIRNISLMENFLLYLLNNNSKYISLGKIERFFKSMGMKVSKKTLGEYLKYARDVFFVFTIEIFSHKIKDRLQYPRKIYSIDTGIVNTISPESKENRGRLYENIVFLHLHREKQKHPGMGIYYWKDREGREVDFVITDGLKPQKLIQVSLDVSSPDTMKRETRALLKAMKEFDLKEGLIITEDYSGEEQNKGRHIKFIPLYEWLLLKTEWHKQS